MDHLIHVPQISGDPLLSIYYCPRSTGGTVIKNLPASVGDAGVAGSIPGPGRFPGVGNGNPSQYSCLENSMDRKAWWATVHGVTKNWTRLSTNIQKDHKPQGPYVDGPDSLGDEFHSRVISSQLDFPRL